MTQSDQELLQRLQANMQAAPPAPAPPAPAPPAPAPPAPPASTPEIQFPRLMPPEVRENLATMANAAEVLAYYRQLDAEQAAVQGTPAPDPVADAAPPTPERKGRGTGGRPPKDPTRTDKIKLLCACASGGLPPVHASEYLELLVRI